MDTSISAKATFDAGHTIPKLERCARPNHGHQWTVFAAVSGDLNPDTGFPRGAEKLPDSLDKLAAELSGESLDELLPGVTSSPLGIAASFLEKLVLFYPNLTSVEVICSDGLGGRITRTPRQ